MPPRNSTTTLKSTSTSPSTSFTTSLITTATEYVTSVVTTAIENTTIYNQTTGMPISTTTGKDDRNALYLVTGIVMGASCMAIMCSSYYLYRKAQRCIVGRIESNEQTVNQMIVLSNNNSNLDRCSSDQDLISI